MEDSIYLWKRKPAEAKILRSLLRIFTSAIPWQRRNCVSRGISRRIRRRHQPKPHGDYNSDRFGKRYSVLNFHTLLKLIVAIYGYAFVASVKKPNEVEIYNRISVIALRRNLRHSLLVPAKRKAYRVDKGHGEIGQKDVRFQTVH